MTKAQAIAFLADAGHDIDLRQISDNRSRIAFKYCGTRITLYTHEDDPDFLKLRCSYVLPDRLRNELEVARTVVRVQRRFKVVRMTADVGSRCVVATAEQFVPDGKGFERTFWRTVDLVVAAARKAYREIDLIVADAAAA